MKNVARIGLILLLFFTFGAVAQAQTRGDFEELGKGFKIAPAIQADGQRSLLIVFPEEYLKEKDKYREGAFEALILVFGCETFKDCKPVEAGLGAAKDGTPFVIVDTVDSRPFRILIFKLADKIPPQPIGVVVLIEPKVITGGKLTR